MSKFFSAAAVLFFLAACQAPQAQPDAANEAAELEEEVPAADLSQVAAADQASPKIFGTNEASSPFERETVIRLNAIVQRSLDAINDYDGRRAEILAAADAAAAGDAEARVKAEEGAAFVRDLHGRAKLALEDLMTAENDVKTSGEVYNAAILAGMVTFVTKVEAELRTASENLDVKLSSSPAN